MKCYDQHPQKIASVNPKDFVRNIAWRIYTEWCLDKEESKNMNLCFGYNGRSYLKWVADERLYASQRKQDHMSREAILSGVVNRAVELFGDWKGKTHSGENQDRRNLRGSLEQYLS